MDEENIRQTGPAPGQPTLPAGRPAARRRFGAGARWLTGLAVAVVLAGGSVLGVSLTASGNPQAAGALLTGSTSGDTRAGTAGGGTGQPTTASSGSAGHATRAFAGLRACVASAGGLRAAGHHAAARARLRSCMRHYLRMCASMRTRLHAGLRAGLARLWLLARRALHGQITVATKTGPRTIAFERGTVESISGSSVVVKAADGTALTWQVGRTTGIFKDGRRAGPSALAAGQRVFVIGQRAAGSDDARRVVLRG